MRILSGGQSGVDRAALDVALACGIAYGGWCPRGGWAEDFPSPPGVLAKYPLLRETPLADPAQRTEWNVRDADAVLIIVDAGGLSVSKGTSLADAFTARCGKPSLVLDLSASDAVDSGIAWLRGEIGTHGADLRLGIGGPRESESPGIYAKTKGLLQRVLGES